jgi:ABC-type multidrug transport system ATPase subunit
MQLFVDHITKKYTGKTLFQPVHFSIATGQSLSITGPNGSGKTTLLHIITGYTKADGGSVYLCYPPSDKKENIHIHHVAHSGIQLRLFEDMTIQQSVECHFTFRKPIHLDAHTEVLQLMKPVNRQQKISELSAGWYNRLKTYLHILTRSDILLLDEPFSNLDTTGIAEMTEIIHRYKLDRILLVAGNRPEEIQLSDQVYHIQKHASDDL